MPSRISPRPAGRWAAVTAGAALAAFLTAGCHDDASSTPPTTVVTTPPASTTTVTPGGTATVSTPPGPDTKINTNAGPGGSTGTDAALADQVNTAIVHNKQMTGSRVEAVASSGVVTLTGQVQNQQQKALAEKTASQVPGVSPGIKNKLIIVSTGGAKPKPTVITKTVVIHDQAAPAPTDAGSGDASQTPAPAAPDSSAAPAPTTSAPATPTGTGNP